MRAALTSFVTIGLVSASFFEQPALADPPIGSLIDRSGRGLTKQFDRLRLESPRLALNVYLRCVAALNRTRASQMLDLTYQSEEQREALDKIQKAVTYSDPRREDCFSNLGSVRIGYDTGTASGAFSEFFILDRFRDEDVESIARLTTDDWKEEGLTPRNGSEMIGLCVAQAGGAYVLELVQSEPESDEEAAAFRKVVPLVGPCLTDGVEVAFDKASLRSLLAFGLYKALNEMNKLGKFEA